jgi:hypothetical protein
MKIWPLCVPSGDDTEIQYNDRYIFGGDPLFVWQDTETRCGVGLNDPRDTLEVYKRFVTDPVLFNTLIGDDAGNALTVGVRNALAGYHSALYTDSDDNTSWGYLALGGDGGSGNIAKCTAVGSLALGKVTAGADTTTAAGYMAGGRVTTHSGGVFLGPYAGCRQTT